MMDNVCKIDVSILPFDPKLFPYKTFLNALQTVF
jgi:hypothetical protein